MEALEAVEAVEAVVGFWDEIHKEQIVGLLAGIHFFPCDTNGKYDLKGLIVSEPGTWLHMKYPEQGRLSLGVAAILLMGGEEKGWWCEPYDYMGGTIINMAGYQKLTDGKICCVTH